MVARPELGRKEQVLVVRMAMLCHQAVAPLSYQAATHLGPGRGALLLLHCQGRRADNGPVLLLALPGG